MTAKLTVPTIDFDRVQGRVHRHYDPWESNPHHVLFGQSGSGKSYLIRHGILPIAPLARVVVIDVKGDRDRTWTGWGKSVDHLPETFGGDGGGPVNMQYRLIVDRSDGKRQVKQALERVQFEGHTILVIDESRSVTEREQMNLGSLLEAIIRESRSDGVTVILGAQSTSWAVGSVKDQPACVWVGHMRNTDQARALAKIAGYGAELVPVISSITPRKFLYADSWGDEPALALTSLGNAAS